MNNSVGQQAVFFSLTYGAIIRTERNFEGTEELGNNFPSVTVLKGRYCTSRIFKKL